LLLLLLLLLMLRPCAPSLTGSMARRWTQGLWCKTMTKIAAPFLVALATMIARG